MELYDAIETRRTVRKFTDEKIPEDLLRKVLETACKVPSWKNTRTPRFTAVTDPVKIAEIAEKGAFGMPHNSGIFANAACILIQSAKKGMAGWNSDGTATTIYGDSYTFFDAGIAAQNISLSASAEGLGTVIMGIIDYDKIAEIISLPDDEEIICAISMGYPAAAPNTPPKYTVDEIVRFM